MLRPLEHGAYELDEAVGHFRTKHLLYERHKMIWRRRALVGVCELEYWDFCISAFLVHFGVRKGYEYTSIDNGLGW